MEVREIITDIMIELRKMPKEEIFQIHKEMMEQEVFTHPMTKEAINIIMKMN